MIPRSRFTRPSIILLMLGIALTADAADFDHAHTLLDKVLQARVKHELVDYAALKAGSKDLDAYLAQCAAVTEASYDKWPEPQRLAFMINLYNAGTLRLVLDHYPVKTIKKIGGLFRGPWDQPVVRLFGKNVTLGSIEHQILRVKFDEPRIHFAIVCASVGCPPLRAGAYQAARLEDQLEEQGRIFLRSKARNSVDLPARTLRLSPLFKWFAADFERRHGTVAKFVAPYFPNELRGEIEKGGFRVKYTDYDWSLNDTARPGK